MDERVPEAGFDLRRTRRPDPTGHPGPPGPGRNLGDGAGPALRDDPARDLQAPQGAGARGARQPPPRGAAAPCPARGPAARRGDRVAGALPPFLESALGAPRRPARRNEDRLEEARTHEAQKTLNPPRRRAMNDPRALKIDARGDREIEM